MLAVLALLVTAEVGAPHCEVNAATCQLCMDYNGKCAWESNKCINCFYAYNTKAKCNNNTACSWIDDKFYNACYSKEIGCVTFYNGSDPSQTDTPS